jgi:hypothetical protein
MTFYVRDDILYVRDDIVYVRDDILLTCGKHLQDRIISLRGEI